MNTEIVVPFFVRFKSNNSFELSQKFTDMAIKSGVNLRQEVPLIEYPKYRWKLKLNESGYPLFRDFPTISRYLLKEKDTKICPFGDLPSPVALIEKAEAPQNARNAYLISALRFELNPCNEIQKEDINQLSGIPESIKKLCQEIEFKKDRVNVDRVLKASSEDAFDLALAQIQLKARCWYHQELVPKMNANPFAPELHECELLIDRPKQLIIGNINLPTLPFRYPYSYRTSLSREMVHDLNQYVRLQNSPSLFFELMQWLERDVLKLRWQSSQKKIELSNKDATIEVMTNWCDRDGHVRKKHEVFPVGVPIAYIQSIRRKGQPFITQEFARKSHGEMTHWLQEHIWRRFCYQNPEKCQMQPSKFLSELGYIHPAFPDAIYESHMPNLSNPANTYFWYILQYYLPFLSPWS